MQMKTEKRCHCWQQNCAILHPSVTDINHPTCVVSRSLRDSLPFLDAYHHRRHRSIAPVHQTHPVCVTVPGDIQATFIQIVRHARPIDGAVIGFLSRCHVDGYTGTILGALIPSVLNSMLTFLNVGQAIQQVVYGSIVLLLAWGYAGLTRRV